MKNTFLISCILIIFSCEKNKVPPFTLKNQNITLDQVETDRYSKQWDSIDALIHSKVNLQPNFDNLPFGLRIGETKEVVLKKIDKLNIKILEQKKFHGRSIIVIKSTINSVENSDASNVSKLYKYGSFLLESTLTFDNKNNFVEIYQRFFIPEQFVINYVDAWQTHKYNESYLSSKEYIETELNVLIDVFLKTYKSKYGEENYAINQRYNSNNKTLIQYNQEMLWLKNGVLIYFNKENSAADYAYNKLNINNVNLETIPFAVIKYSSIKQYFENIRDTNQFMDSIYKNEKKEIDKNIKTRSLKNIKNGL